MNNKSGKAPANKRVTKYFQKQEKGGIINSNGQQASSQDVSSAIKKLRNMKKTKEQIDDLKHLEKR